MDNLKSGCVALQRTLNALWVAALFGLIWACILSVQLSKLHADLTASRHPIGEIQTEQRKDGCDQPPPIAASEAKGRPEPFAQRPAFLQLLTGYGISKAGPVVPMQTFPFAPSAHDSPQHQGATE